MRESVHSVRNIAGGSPQRLLEGLEAAESARRGGLCSPQPLPLTRTPASALIVFEDESGVSLLLAVQATWTPRGQTRCSTIAWRGPGFRSGARIYELHGSDAPRVF
jgi:hypothetical protein